MKKRRRKPDTIYEASLRVRRAFWILGATLLRDLDKLFRFPQARSRGEDAACLSILIEMHPTYPCSIQTAYDGGIHNPYSRWLPWHRWEWQLSFDKVRREREAFVAEIDAQIPEKEGPR